MQVTTFSGEGATYRFAQGLEAITGVAAHEALNMRVFERHAIQSDTDIVNPEIKIKFAVDPVTKRVVVVGGESRVTFKPKKDKNLTILEETPEELKKEVKELVREKQYLEFTFDPNNSFLREKLETIEKRLDLLRVKASIKGVFIDTIA
ncbi:MAG: hypothetical protein ACP5RW_05910 [bacterium]